MLSSEFRRNCKVGTLQFTFSYIFLFFLPSQVYLMADKPSRALVIYADGFAPFVSLSRHSHLNSLAFRSSCGFLSLRGHPKPGMSCWFAYFLYFGVLAKSSFIERLDLCLKWEVGTVIDFELNHIRKIYVSIYSEQILLLCLIELVPNVERICLCLKWEVSIITNFELNQIRKNL